MLRDGFCGSSCLPLHLFLQAFAISDAIRERGIELPRSVPARLATWFFSYASNSHSQRLNGFGLRSDPDILNFLADLARMRTYHNRLYHHKKQLLSGDVNDRLCLTFPDGVDQPGCMVDDSDYIRAEAIASLNRTSVTLPLFQSTARQHTVIYSFNIRRLDGRDVDLAFPHRDDVIGGFGWTGLD